MTDRLNQIGRWWTWSFLRQVPMIANRDMISSMKELHVADDFRDNAAQTVANRDYTRTLKLRRLHMQKIVNASIRQVSSENVKSGEV